MAGIFITSGPERIQQKQILHIIRDYPYLWIPIYCQIVRIHTHDLHFPAYMNLDSDLVLANPFHDSRNLMHLPPTQDGCSGDLNQIISLADCLPVCLPIQVENGGKMRKIVTDAAYLVDSKGMAHSS
jgi:hypothetical protein